MLDAAPMCETRIKQTIRIHYLRKLAYATLRNKLKTLNLF